MNEEKNFCKKCGTAIAKDSTFCPKCGQNKNEEIKHGICTGCGAILPYGYGLCEECNQLRKEANNKGNAIALLVIAIILMFVGYFVFGTISDLGSKLSVGNSRALPKFTEFSLRFTSGFLLSLFALIPSCILAKKTKQDLLFALDIIIMVFGLIIFLL